MSTGSTRAYRNHGILGSAWAGLSPLWLVFWVYGVIGGNLVAYAYENIASPSGKSVFGVLTFAYYVWLNVSTWRCAPNSSPIWSFLARALVVLTVLSLPWWVWEEIQGSA